MRERILTAIVSFIMSFSGAQLFYERIQYYPTHEIKTYDDQAIYVIFSAIPAIGTVVFFWMGVRCLMGNPPETGD